MERKTKVHAEDGKQELVITREFDLPLELLFKAYSDPAILSQWMRTRVVKLENRRQGAWEFETTDPQGNVVFRASGVVHDFVAERTIIRTFEMEGTPFEPQLEFLDFKSLTDDTSKLTMQIVFRSIAMRDQLLKLPFAHGLGMAHDRLQEIASQTPSTP